MITTKTRFELALTAIRTAGFHAVLDTEACCRSCAVDAAPTGGDLALGVLAHARRARWNGNDMTALYDDQRMTVASLLFNFATIEAARACRKAFRAEGFTVEWNGRKNRCVRVHLG